MNKWKYETVTVQQEVLIVLDVVMESILDDLFPVFNNLEILYSTMGGDGGDKHPWTLQSQKYGKGLEESLSLQEIAIE